MAPSKSDSFIRIPRATFTISAPFFIDCNTSLLIMFSFRGFPERPEPHNPRPTPLPSTDGYRSPYEILRLLNHDVRTHTLQRQIRRAGTASRRGRRAEELSAQSGALALVTTLVITWNTHALQATLNRWHAEVGKKIDRATLRHITPMGFEHINFNGVLIFPLEIASEID
jgi:hypothetical protein